MSAIVASHTNVEDELCQDMDGRKSNVYPCRLN